MLREKLGIDSINISSSSVGSKHEEFDGNINMDDQDTDDSNITAGGPAGLKNLSSDSTAVPRIKILKVAPMENVNQDYIINIFDFVSEDNNDYASDPSAESFQRMPARLEKTDRYSFSFYTEQYSKNLDAGKAQQTLTYIIDG
jgi:hypothetical protein